MFNYKYTLLFLFLLGILSCEDFLDRPPLDAIGNDSYWRTSGDLERYVLQYYSNLPGHSGVAMAREDANSDNLTLTSVDPVLNGERGITTGNWINEWDDIRSINIFFDNYQRVEDGFETYRHFLGEAHFFKAWFYFELLKKYGDLPWYAHTLGPDSEELSKPRDQRTLVADSILAHLDKAITYLNPRSEAGNTRLNKEAALAFKTRVALFEGTWQKYHSGSPFGTADAQPEKYFQACVEAAEELIQNDYIAGVYTTGNPDEDYYTLFGLGNMSSINEVLLYRVANASEGLGNNVQAFTTARTGGMAVTWSLVTSYLDKNGEPLDYLNLSKEFKGNDFLLEIAQRGDPRLHATVWFPGDLRAATAGTLFDKPFIDRGGEELCASGFQVKKFSDPYAPEAGLFGSGGSRDSETGYILFRYGEVLLNYAEALYELEGTIAYEALNLLRKRAGMPDFKVHPQAADPNRIDYGYQIADELYEIRRERRVEMALEGHRAEDYRRWAAHAMFQDKRPLGYPFKQSEFPDFDPALNEGALMDYMKDRLPNGYQFREYQDYLDDIPQDELTLNPNLEQNPGW